MPKAYWPFLPPTTDNNPFTEYKAGKDVLPLRDSILPICLVELKG